MIIATDARALTLNEMRSLELYCSCQRESLWDDLDLQGILDVYHANSESDGVEYALAHGNEVEVYAIRSAVKRSKARHRRRSK